MRERSGEPLIVWRRDGYALFGVAALIAGVMVGSAWGTSWPGRITSAALLIASYVVPWRYGPER